MKGNKKTSPTFPAELVGAGLPELHDNVCVLEAGRLLQRQHEGLVVRDGQSALGHSGFPLLGNLHLVEQAHLTSAG